MNQLTLDDVIVTNDTFVLCEILSQHQDLKTHSILPVNEVGYGKHR